MNGVRYQDSEWEGRCDECREWWPLDHEFWSVRAKEGARRCRACINDGKREIQRRYRERVHTPVDLEAHRIANRKWRNSRLEQARRADRERKRAAYYRRHREGAAA